jgi:methionyl-tRNA formyltransferase
MRILFIGSVQFSETALRHLFKLGAEIVGVCTNKSPLKNSDFVDLTALAEEFNIPCRYADDINSWEVLDWMKSLSPDVIFCFGWSRLLSHEILKLTVMGVVGFHPSLLPANRGRHPIIWSLALGLEQTGSTFFFMDADADSGDILSQKIVPIFHSDNARTLYDRIVMVALAQISEFLPQLISKDYGRTAQNSRLANSWRKRSKIDGEIDWRMSATSVYNLVRALSDPYPGATVTYQEVEYKVLDVEVISEKSVNIEPGKILGLKNFRPIIKCGIDCVCLTTTQPDLKVKIGDYL